MIVRRSSERGYFDHGWLKTWHTFSFAGYFDPSWTGFRALRVLNDDTVSPGGGFPTHPHRDMEIITYVVKGQIQHRDSLGVNATLQPGEIQVMSAGSGILHSEFNPSDSDELRLLQIWVIPNTANLKPRYDQAEFDQSITGQWILLAAPVGAQTDSLTTIHADVKLLRGRLTAGQSLAYEVGEGRACWLQAVSGSGLVNGFGLSQGDGIALTDQGVVTISADGHFEVLLFDLN